MDDGMEPLSWLLYAQKYLIRQGSHGQQDGWSNKPGTGATTMCSRSLLQSGQAANCTGYGSTQAVRVQVQQAAHKTQPEHTIHNAAGKSKCAAYKPLHLPHCRQAADGARQSAR